MEKVGWVDRVSGGEVEGLSGGGESTSKHLESGEHRVCWGNLIRMAFQEQALRKGIGKEARLPVRLRWSAG